MGKVCAAYGCSNSPSHKDISLHMFPKDPILKQKWAHAMRRNGFEPNNSSVVCSVHFRPEDFEVAEKGKSIRRKRLKKTCDIS